MLTTFIDCPNPDCRYKPSGGPFGGAWMHVYECRECGFQYCYRCGDDCYPRCASKDRREIGKVWAK